jgi:hypothetical protein
MEPKGDAYSDTRYADVGSKAPARTLKHPEIPGKLRQIACGIRDTLARWHRDELGHYPYRVRFVPAPVWCYAAWALREGFDRRAIIRTYRLNALDCTLIARERRDNESPALTIWKARRELERSRLPAAPKKPTEKIMRPLPRQPLVGAPGSSQPAPVAAEPPIDCAALRCWQAVSPTLKRSISEKNWEAFFSNLRPIDYKDNTLRLLTRTFLQKTWIETQFAVQLARIQQPAVRLVAPGESAAATNQ